MAFLYLFLITSSFALNAQAIRYGFYPRHHHCSTNEAFQECGSACYIEPTCRNPNPVQPTICTEQCVQRCACSDGFVRNEDTNSCVRIEKCPACPNCPPNELFDECGSACYIEPTCQEPNPIQPRFCTKQCVQRCVCDESNGYIRDNFTKICIRREDCPICPGVCEYNEVFNECASACEAEPTCQNPYPVPDDVCTLQCIQRCECDSQNGYIRDEETGTCVLRSECPVCPDSCGPLEHMGCRPCCPESIETCQNRHPKPCKEFCPFICYPVCACDEGYLRDEDSGNCVSPHHCPPPRRTIYYHHH